MARHKESCKACKAAIGNMLAALYGEVKLEHCLDIPTKPEGYSDPVLHRIHDELVAFRGHKDFEGALPLKIDYYVPSRKLIVEFDEGQHFTKLRALTLALYPADLAIRFDPARWQQLSEDRNRRDNNPIYRDEQRAWRDTLRDFAPLVSEYKYTARLYARDEKWCTMDPENEADQAKFVNYINM